MDPATYQQQFGLKPERDDLQRVNCKMPGVIGHLFCGVCKEHNKPRFLCGCAAKPEVKAQ